MTDNNKNKNSVPPHLPPPVCDIDKHKQWQRLKIIFAAAGMGLLAGLSGAAMTIGWIWPLLGDGDTWATSRAGSSASGAKLEERVFKERVVGRIVGVYSGVSAMGMANFFDAQQKIGDAMVIGSDGWLAMYYSGYIGNFKKWQVLANNGSVYKLDKAIVDPASGLIFLKVIIKDGSTIADRVMDLNYTVNPGDRVLVYQKDNWYGGAIGFREVTSISPVHIDTAPVVFYSLEGAFNVGSIVVNEQGKVAGVVAKNNLLLPNVYLSRILPSVLNQERVIYPSLGVDGWYSGERPIILKEEKVNGFLVSRVWGKFSPLRRGDVILEINGQVFDPDILWYNISNKTVKLKVWRSGAIFEIDSPTTANN